MQSKWLTTLEVLTNTFTGLLGSWLITLYFIRGGGNPIETATMITLLCTVWSILRGYVIRRIFNKIAHRPANVKTYFDEQSRKKMLQKLYDDKRQFDKDIEEWDKK